MIAINKTWVEYFSVSYGTLSLYSAVNHLYNKPIKSNNILLKLPITLGNINPLLFTLITVVIIMLLGVSTAIYILIIHLKRQHPLQRFRCPRELLLIYLKLPFLLLPKSFNEANVLHYFNIAL
mgnify:FL=1